MLKRNDEKQQAEDDLETVLSDETGTNVTPEQESVAAESHTELEPNRSWSVTGASRTGKVRSENQDAYATHRIGPDQHILVLCDGAGGHAGGKEAAVVASQTILSVLKSPISVSPLVDPIQRIEEAIDITRKEFNALKLEGVTTAIVALLDGDWLHYATLGDGGLSLVWSSGMTTEVLTPHHQRGKPSNQIGGFIGHHCEVAPRVGSIKLEKDVTVFLMSDGASDLFDLEFYADNRKKFASFQASGLKGLADRFLEQLEQARDEKSGSYLHQDNMTMILAHLSEEEAQSNG